MRYLASPVAAIALTLVLCSCAGKPPKSTLPEPAALKSLEEENADSKTRAPAEDAVKTAARPFSGFRPEDGETFTDEQLLTYLASADAICIGERHDQVLDHYAELRLLEGIAERRALRGFELGLALEMVQTSEQPTLSAYQEGKVTDEDFEGLSRWSETWGFPIQFYRPQLQLAAHEQVQLLALGVDRDFTRQIARVGLKGLSETEASAVPEIDAADVEHRALFDGMMEGHPMEKGSADQYYEAQLVWDEAMAEKAASWLNERAPGRKLIIMAGTAHCHRTAIPARMGRRTGARVVSLLPVEGGAPKKAKESPQGAEERLVAGYDYQMVFAR